MNSAENENHQAQESATTPVVTTKESSDSSNSEKLKIMNSTPNGYNSVSNHKIELDGPSAPPKKQHDVYKSAEYNQSDSLKQNSEHGKSKDGHISKHSSSSHSNLKDGDVKSSSHKSSELSSKHQEQRPDKEKHHSKSNENSSEYSKHHKSNSNASSELAKSNKVSGGSSSDHVKHQKASGDGNSEHSKHSLQRSSGDKLKEHKSSSKHSPEGVKKPDILKEEKHKEKQKSHSSENKEKHKDPEKHKEKLKKLEGSKDKIHEKMKDKSERSAEKSSDKLKSVESEKHKDKTSEKHKDKSLEKPKDKSPEKLKEKSVDKPKDKSLEKPKDKSFDKPKDKSLEKHKDKSLDKHKDKSDEKHKEKLAEKPKDKSGEKPKDKHSEKHKEKSKDKEGSGEKLKDKGLLDKPKEKHDAVKDKSTDKVKDKGEKLKDPSVKIKKDKDDSSMKIKKEKDDSGVKIKKEKDSSVKIKKEKDSSETKTSKTEDDCDKKAVKEVKNKSPAIVKIKQEEISPIKGKAEGSCSEDEVPLSVHAAVKQEKKKAMKRPKVIDDADSEEDEPLSRMGKTKKIKKEQSKKRKVAEESDYDSDYKKPSKKVKKEKKGKNEKSSPTTETASPRKRGKKEEEQEVWKWWEEEKKEDGVKWNTLQHHGPVFAPLYERVPKNIKFYYDGKHLPLSEETEEVAGFYGRMLDHDYTTKEVFNTNFFKDFRKVMTPEEKETLKDLKKCNFNDFNVYYKQKSEERKAMTKEEKAVIKKQNEEMTETYGFCIVDGHKQKIGNFKIEPPGLFRGRGEHPKMGMLKRRVQPEDVIINIGKEAKVPDPPDGHRWKKITHDNKVTWLASWNENILNSTKYVMLNPSSKLKGEKDWQKYETARKLKNHADRIRNTYTNDFKSKEMRVRQRAVALYFIDKLALRAGNEKDEDTADTVGCCSLRVEHITLDEENDGQQYVVSFDFLGKDSIRYQNSVPVEKRAFKNLKLFMENKQPGDDLFDRLNTAILNKYLNDLMEGLTAKVFRTYNASKTLQQQLDLLTKEEMSVPEKLLAYNRANRAVAVLCNHQRAIPKTFSKSMEALKTKMDEKIKQIKDFKKDVKLAKQDAKNGSAKEKMIYDKKKKRLQQLEEQLKKLEVQATDREENKQIALGTSKLNYLDPRISVAWCKKWDVPIEKIYNRTQRDKFRWAIEMAGPEFVF